MSNPLTNSPVLTPRYRCDRCKARKSKCIEATPGACERCLKSALSCQFEKDLSSGEGDDPSPGVASNVTQMGTTPGNGPDDNITINSRTHREMGRNLRKNAHEF